jgi:succinate dehydrogenase / fumarate reductase cytochrome b subunit
MRWSGVALLLFVVLHLLHMTTGSLHPHFVVGSPYHNVVNGLTPKPVALGYLIAAVAVGLHARHGLLAVLRGYVASSKAHGRFGSRFALWVALMLGVGFALVPLAVALEVLR